MKSQHILLVVEEMHKQSAALGKSIMSGAKKMMGGLKVPGAGLPKPPAFGAPIKTLGAGMPEMGSQGKLLAGAKKQTVFGKAPDGLPEAGDQKALLSQKVGPSRSPLPEPQSKSLLSPPKPKFP